MFTVGPHLVKNYKSIDVERKKKKRLFCFVKETCEQFDNIRENRKIEIKRREARKDKYERNKVWTTEKEKVTIYYHQTRLSPMPIINSKQQSLNNKHINAVTD